MACKTELTYVYSSPCISYLRELIESLDSTFSIKDKLDDMFWYGVFCKPETYSNYRCYHRYSGILPGELKESSSEKRLTYVNGILRSVIKGEIEKPEWMFFVEEYEAFNQFEDSPSTFLYLIPKDAKYRKFGEALTNFLYSPNLMITLKN